MPLKFKLKVLLAMNEMTQKQLAEVTGIRPPTISAICTNSVKQLPVGVIEKICEVLNCQPGDLMEYLPGQGNCVCSSCGKRFTYSISNGGYPGGKDREYIYCPWCKAENGSTMTSGIINTQKVE
ncbi:MAG: helix-turn-helix domain-containing protein [Aminipila sp.]